MWRSKLTITKKNSTTLLGGATLKEKLSKARMELGDLQNDNSSVIARSEEDNVDNFNDLFIKESPSKDSPKFHLTGRCDRKNHKYSTKAFYILEDLDVEIKRYCNGGDVAVFNYLLHLGLSEIKKRDGHSFDEVSIMEDSYNIT